MTHPTITLDLTPEDLEEAVRQFVRQRDGLEVTGIRFGSHAACPCPVCGCDEPRKTYLTGATAEARQP